eukprot:symbB.v1.2.025411.t1/scaffold2462.1/size78695/4
MVRVCVRNTFISFDFGEDGDGIPVSSRGPAMSRSKSMERMNDPIDQAAAEQMSKLNKILDNDQEAVRSAMSPITVPTKKAIGGKDSTTPQELTQLRQRLQKELGGANRKWSEESSTTAEDDKDIRQSMSNSSVSTMTSFEANRSRACSNGSISSYVDEFTPEVDFNLQIQEQPNMYGAGAWHVDSWWKPKRQETPMHFGYNKRWKNSSYYGHESSGESMVGSPFTTPTPSPKLTKEMMHGQYGTSYKDKMRNLPRDSRHNRVPRNVNLQEEYQSKEKDVTTLMIRNIPNRYTQRELIAELEDLGFAGTFDFLYSPLDKGTMSNVGYAFVNFKTHEDASKCIAAFHNYRFKRHRKTSGKVAAVSAAHLQGLEANLAHYEKTAVNSAKMKQRRPVVL